MAAGEVRAGRAFMEILARDGLTKSLQGILRGASGKLSAFSRTFAAGGAGLLGGAAAIAAPLIAATNVFASVGGELDDISQRTGMAVEAVSGLGFAAKRSGTDLATIEKSSLKLSKTLLDAAGGSTAAQSAFQDLGLSWQDLAAKSPDDQLTSVLDAMAGVEDGGRRSALAMGVLGKSGAQLSPLAGNFRELIGEAEGLGLIMSSDTAAKAAILGDALDDLSAVVQDAWVEVGSGLAPAVVALARGARDVLVPVNRFISANRDWLMILVPIVAGLAAGGAALLGFALVLKVVALGIPMLLAPLGALLSPVGLLIALVVGGAYAWTRWSASGKAAVSGVINFFGPLLQTAQETLGGIADALMAGDLQLAAQIGVLGLQTIFLEGIQRLGDLVPAGFGPLVDWLSTMAVQLSEGRWSELGQSAMAGLRAAWQAGVTALQSLWSSFTRGVVNAMAAAAGGVATLWGKAVEGIANRMLSMASSSAAMGKLFGTVLGVDMYEQKERAAKMGTGGAEFDAQARAATAAWTAAARAPLDDALDAWTDTANAKSDELLLTAGQNLEQAIADLTPAGPGAGRSQLTDALEENRRQLAAAIAAAETARASGKKAAANQQQGEEDLAESGTGAKSMATFSSYALAQQFGAQSTAQQQLTEQRRTNTLLAEQLSAVKAGRSRRVQPGFAYGT